MTTKSIADIKIDINNLTNDIKDLDYDGKVAAIQHMKETISLLKLGNELVTQTSLFNDDLGTLDHATDDTLIGMNTKCIEDDSNNDLLNATEVSYSSDEFLEEAVVKLEDTGFNLNPDTSQNIISQDNIKMFECTECQKRFTTQHSLTTHKNIHTDKHKCSNCQQRFYTNQALKSHNCEITLKRRNKETTYFCQMCLKSFACKNAFNRHKIAHTDKFKCSGCDKGFKDNNSLQRHKLKISNCVKFKKSFLQNEIETKQETHTVFHEENIRININESANIFEATEEGDYKSKHVIDTTDESPAPDVHDEILNLSKDVKEEYFPEDLKTTIDEKEEISLKVETYTNTSLQIYQCNECPAYFYSEKPLKTHKNVHTDKYKCDTCQQRLCNGKELRMHQCDKPVKRRKISDFLLECEQCPKKYSNKDSLRNHRNEHTDRFKCEECNMRCQSISSLNRHRKALHAYNPLSNIKDTPTGVEEDEYELISCDICEKFFATKESLKNHAEKSLCMLKN